MRRAIKNFYLILSLVSFTNISGLFVQDCDQITSFTEICSIIGQLESQDKNPEQTDIQPTGQERAKNINNITYQPEIGLKKPETVPQGPFWYKVAYIIAKLKAISTYVVLF